MTSGYRIIKELGKKGLRGYYFSHRQYKDLAKTKDFSEAKEKIVKWGYPDVIEAKDASEVVILLKKSTALTNDEKGCLTVMLLEPLFWLLLLAFSGC